MAYYCDFVFSSEAGHRALELSRYSWTVLENNSQFLLAVFEEDCNNYNVFKEDYRNYDFDSASKNSQNTLRPTERWRAFSARVILQLRGLSRYGGLDCACLKIGIQVTSIDVDIIIYIYT